MVRSLFLGIIEKAVAKTKIICKMLVGHVNQVYYQSNTVQMYVALFKQKNIALIF
jgi:hypothetical protein